MLAPKEAKDRAKKNAFRALELDNTLAETQTSVAFYYVTYEWNFPAAEEHFRQAVERNPKYGLTYHLHSANLLMLGLANDAIAANALIDQVKYEKNVQWLGDDPFLLRRAERAFINTTPDIFVSTLIWITMGLGLAIFVGIGTGFLLYNLREQKRRLVPNFTDAGGMTRLNLDGFTPDIEPKGLVGD